MVDVVVGNERTFDTTPDRWRFPQPHAIAAE
jgi:hypothetical protein